MIFPRSVGNLPLDIRKKFDFSSASVNPISGISVIIPIRGLDRQPNLNYCISRMLLQNVEPLEIIVSEEDFLESINIDKFKSDSRVRKIFTKSNMQLFNKSVAVNAGFAAASHNKLLMNDADIVVPRGYLQRISNALDENDSCFFGKEIFNVDLLRNGLIWRGSKRTDYFSGGSVAFTRKAFLTIGGMCERFAGYGSEDCEFWERLTRLTKMLEQRDLPLLHINHKRPFVYSQNVELYESLVKKPIEDRLLDLKIDLDKRILGAK